MLKIGFHSGRHFTHQHHRTNWIRNFHSKRNWPRRNLHSKCVCVRCVAESTQNHYDFIRKLGFILTLTNVLRLWCWCSTFWFCRRSLITATALCFSESHKTTKNKNKIKTWSWYNPHQYKQSVGISFVKSGPFSQAKCLCVRREMLSALHIRRQTSIVNADDGSRTIRRAVFFFSLAKFVFKVTKLTRTTRNEWEFSSSFFALDDSGGPLALNLTERNDKEGDGPENHVNLQRNLTVDWVDEYDTIGLVMWWSVWWRLRFDYGLLYIWYSCQFNASYWIVGCLRAKFEL